MKAGTSTHNLKYELTITQTKRQFVAHAD